jgi:hypothetical protein
MIRGHIIKKGVWMFTLLLLPLTTAPHLNKKEKILYFSASIHELNNDRSVKSYPQILARGRGGRGGWGFTRGRGGRGGWGFKLNKGGGPSRQSSPTPRINKNGSVKPVILLRKWFGKWFGWKSKINKDGSVEPPPAYIPKINKDGSSGRELLPTPRINKNGSVKPPPAYIPKINKDGSIGRELIPAPKINKDGTIKRERIEIYDF